MVERVITFDFDIQPSTTQIRRNLLPDGEAEVTFTIHNTSGFRQRASVILEPLSGPGGEGRTENLALWLDLMEPREFDFQPNRHHTSQVRIKIRGSVVPGTYSFRLLLQGHDELVNEYLPSDIVFFNVEVPRIKPMPFLLIGILLLLFIIGGAVAARLLIKPASAFEISLTPPVQAVVGQPAPFSVEIKNQRGDVTLERMVMDYTYPPGVLAAWAELNGDTSGQVTLRCGSADLNTHSTGILRCAMGDIPPNTTVTITVNVLPGPEALANGIGSEEDFTYAWVENGGYKVSPARKPLELTPTPKDESTPQPDLIQVVEASEEVSGAAVPAANSASVSKPVKITLLGWSKHKEPVTLQYVLPQGMRYASLPPECAQKEDYFTLVCNTQTAQPYYLYELSAIPLQPSTGYRMDMEGWVGNNKPVSLSKDNRLPALNDQLVFDGEDDWAQLGTNYLPDTFTLEMWVNPASLEDGQALIGAHRHLPGSKEVLNRFLVGYYNGSININVMGLCRNMDMPKTAAPFHLAVVVENRGSAITAYKDGVMVELLDAFCCRAACPAAGLLEDLDQSKGEIDYQWVIAQEWDANGNSIIPSDFFHGSISDVRLYSRALTPSQIQEDMLLPPPLCDPSDATCAQPGLTGWWPVTQPAGETADCHLALDGMLPDQPAALQAGCVLVDLGPNLKPNPGAYSGTSGESTRAHFGSALAFDGKSIIRQEKIEFSGFKSSKEDSNFVPVTISAWIAVDMVPTRRQIILEDRYFLNHGKSRISFDLEINQNGHVQARYERAYACESGGRTLCASESIVVDDRTIPAGRWVHYAAQFWYDRTDGSLYQKNGLEKLLLFRDGQKVKSPTDERQIETDVEGTLPASGAPNPDQGLSIGGIQRTRRPQKYTFVGRIDEIRIWNRALYGDVERGNNISTNIDLFRRLPGVAFDEYVYWHFDTSPGQTADGICKNAPCADEEKFRLTIDGPAWVPNDLSLGYTR